MAYEKTTWVDGETEIDAQKLNKMEEGIVEASQTGGILTGTIVAYDGDTIPEGYEEVDNPNVYSTEEKFTGKYWIDGKKIYRKEINFTITSNQTSGGFYIDITELKVKTMVLSDGFLGYVNGFHKLGGYANSNYYSLLQLLRTGDIISHLAIFATSNYIDKQSYIILEYTKTTD
jgi:hypothetical protein